jgi:hypothetical protein
MILVKPPVLQLETSRQKVSPDFSTPGIHGNAVKVKMMFSSFFKKSKSTSEQIDQLNEANLALRVRMDKIMHLSTAKQAVPSKPARPVFEGRVAA